MIPRRRLATGRRIAPNRQQDTFVSSCRVARLVLVLVLVSALHPACPS